MVVLGIWPESERMAGLDNPQALASPIVQIRTTANAGRWRSAPCLRLVWLGRILSNTSSSRMVGSRRRWFDVMPVWLCSVLPP